MEERKEKSHRKLLTTLLPTNHSVQPYKAPGSGADHLESNSWSTRMPFRRSQKLPGLSGYGGSLNITELKKGKDQTAALNCY